LAGHLRRLLGDPELCARLGAAGRAFVEAEFDIRRCAERLEGIYDEVVTEARERPPLAEEATAPA
jgi:glycosyltransferase involved in cell wall biosynthesis